MGTIEIVYSQLDDVSKYATKVAEKCEDYYEKLNTKCLDAFSDLVDSPLGEKNSRTSMAYYYVEQKRKKLDKKKDRFAQFAKDVITFKEDTKEADHRVAKSVNDSQKKFYEQHKNLKGDGWAAFFATVSVDHPVIGYFISKVKSKISTLNSLQNALRHWYEIDGGKKIIDTALAVGELAIAVLTIAAAFTTPAGWIVGACAIISGIIGVWDAVTNLTFQIEADVQKDPAWANHYSNIDDLSSALRITTFKGNMRWFNKYSEGVALGLDVTKFVCGTVDSVNSLYKKSGLNKLFDTEKPVHISVRTTGSEMCKQFDFTKFKSVISTEGGRNEIRKTLKTTVKNTAGKYLGKNNWKNNWKRLIFGHDNASWKTKWTRAFTSQDTKIYERIDKIQKAGSLDLKRFETSVNILKFGSDAFRGDVTLKDTFGAIENAYSLRSQSGGIIETCGDKKDIVVNIKELYDTKGDPQKIVDYGMKKIVG